MFLVNKKTGTLVRIVDLDALFDPFNRRADGRSQAGEEEQELDAFDKQQLMFASGESLPSCWLDPDFRHAASAVRLVTHI